MSKLPDSVVATNLALLAVLFATVVVVGMVVVATAVVTVAVLFVTVVVVGVVVVLMSPVVEK